MFGAFALFVGIGVLSSMSAASQPVIGTQAYLNKKYPNSPFMRALDKSVMVETYRYVPWTEEEIRAFNENTANKKYGYTYEQWYKENYE